MLEHNALVLEILKQEDKLAISIFEQKDLASTLRHYSQQSLSFVGINKLCQEITTILNKPDTIDNLTKIGQLLWDQLLTKPVKNRLRTSHIKDLILSIDEELIHIPWELLYTGEDFLCLKFNLGRVVRTKEQANLLKYRSFSSIPKMLILSNPTNDLASAYQEGLFIKNQFDKKIKEVNISFKSTYIDTLYVKKNLRDYDIVHFAGHYEYDSNTPKNSGWVLSDGRFATQDIYALGETLSLPSLIFSNACHSARISPNLMDVDYQEKTYTLASAFLFSGVRHYIGSIRKIEDQISLDFAKEFYAHLISGKSVGESLRLGRVKLIKDYGVKSVWWTSYLLYGDPNFVLFRPRQAITKPKIKFNRKLALSLSVAVVIISSIIYLYIWLPSINPTSYALFLRARHLFSDGKNEQAILASKSIIKKDPLFLAIYPMLAETYYRLGDRDNTLKYYFDYALACEKRSDKKELASAYIGLAWTYHLQREYAKAFDFYNKAINLSKENQDKLNEARALRKLAVWYIDKQDNDSALELLTRSSEINRQRQHIQAHRYNLACDYFDYGLVFANKKDLATAEEFYRKSYPLFKKLKLANELSDYYFKLGEIYSLKKQYQKALEHYLKGLEIDEAQGNKPNIASGYNMIGELYVAMDNYFEAERFFNQTILLCKQLNAPPQLADAYYNLGILYKDKNQKNKAREYFRQAQEIYRFEDTPGYQKIKKEFLELDNQ